MYLTSLYVCTAQVSPCDGTVLHLGPVDSGRLEQVKGVTYTLNKFLGPSDWETGPQVSQSVWLG